MMSEPMRLEPGTLITDKLRLSKPLREGGMGAVWIADHLSLERRVAVKFVLDQLVRDDPNMLERFDREAKATARIKSPHVVQVFDHGITDEGVPYMVMELLEGNTLLQWLELVKRMSVQEAALVVSQVASVLDKAHRAGVVHRDIKPDNIFLVEGEADLFVKLLDFGLARDRGKALQRVTAAGQFLGTPLYMSPEQVMGGRDADESADLWALAVVAYEMLSGHTPFTGKGLGDLAINICAGKFAPVTSLLPPGAPAALDRWFAQALHLEPAARFRSASALAEAFQRASESKPAPVEPPRLVVGGDGHAVGAATLASRDHRPPSPPSPLRGEGVRAPRKPEPRPQRRVDPYIELATERRSVRVAPTPSQRARIESEPFAGPLLGAVLLGVVALVLAPQLEPARKSALALRLGGAAPVVWAIVAVVCFVLGARVWDHGSGRSLWLSLAGGGLFVLGAAVAFQAFTLAMPGLRLDGYGATAALVGRIGAVAVPLGFGLFGATSALAARGRPEPDAVRIAILALLALVGVAIAYATGRDLALDLLAGPR